MQWTILQTKYSDAWQTGMQQTILVQTQHENELQLKLKQTLGDVTRKNMWTTHDQQPRRHDLTCS